VCLIIAKPEGVTIPDFAIRSAMGYNDDGFGIMKNGYAGRYVEPGFKNIRAMLNADGACVVHFRMATHGPVTKKNCHPMRLPDGSWLMHNGIMPGEFHPTKRDGMLSDTRVFVRDWLAPRMKKLGDLPDKREVEKAIGGNNRLAIMRPDGTVELYNESTWTEYEGALYSNEYAWDYPYTRTYGWTSAARKSTHNGNPSAVITSYGEWTEDTELESYDSAAADLLIAEIRLELMDYESWLDIEAGDLIAAQDYDLWRELYSGELSVYEFIELASEDTIIALYHRLDDLRWSDGNENAWEEVSNG